MVYWTDNPVTTSTTIKAIHIAELRAVVDQGHAYIGEGGYAWTDSPLDSTVPIRAQHFLELRSAIQDLWTAHDQGTLPDWTDAAPSASVTVVRASHTNDLRTWYEEVDPWSQHFLGINVDPQNGCGHPDVTIVKAAGFTAVRLKATTGAREDYINSAVAVGLTVMAIVGVGEPDEYVPTDTTNIILQIGNEPDSSGEASYGQTVPEYLASWERLRPSFPGYVVTAVFSHNVPTDDDGDLCSYAAFIDALQADHPYDS